MESIASGLCLCGCGRSTPLALQTRADRGTVKGRPLRYLPGHARRTRHRPELCYVVEDRGWVTPCWIWTRATVRGYARTKDDSGVQCPAHVLYWEREHGAVPAGLQLHHRCKQKRCVRPDHLEALPDKEHKAQHRRSMCPNGHAYTEENTYWDGNDRRRCRICLRAKGRRRRHQPNLMK